MPHKHAFDPISGWCGWCGYRDDGRLIDRAGTILRNGPAYTPEQLTDMLNRHRQEHHHEDHYNITHLRTNA